MHCARQQFFPFFKRQPRQAAAPKDELTPSSKLPLGRRRTCSASSMSLQPGGSTLHTAKWRRSALQRKGGGRPKQAHKWKVCASTHGRQPVCRLFFLVVLLRFQFLGPMRAELTE